MMSEDVFVKYYDMPPRIKSFVRANPDGSYTIVINSRLSIESRLARYEHELRHIQGGDFDYDKDDSVQLLEARAHAGTPRISRKIVRKRKRRHSAKLRLARKRAELRESLGIDPLASAHERFLDPDR